MSARRRRASAWPAGPGRHSPGRAAKGTHPQESARHLRSASATPYRGTSSCAPDPPGKLDCAALDSIEHEKRADDLSLKSLLSAEPDQEQKIEKFRTSLVKLRR